MTGIIFDVKEGAVHDGPGLRQTVFFMGCPMRCTWYHNPEGLCARPELMVSAAGCTGCGRCKAVCPHPGACDACGRCVKACPLRLRAVAGSAVTAQALAAQLGRHTTYYAQTGGGVMSSS